MKAVLTEFEQRPPIRVPVPVLTPHPGARFKGSTEQVPELHSFNPIYPDDLIRISRPDEDGHVYFRALDADGNQVSTYLPSDEAKRLATFILTAPTDQEITH